MTQIDKKMIAFKVVDGCRIEWRKLQKIYEKFGVLAQTTNGHIKSNRLELSDRVLRNEMVHIMQQRYWGWLWWVIYLYYFVYMAIKTGKGYVDNPFEKESREWQDEYRGWLKVTKYSYRNFLFHKN